MVFAPFHYGDWDTSGRCRTVTPTSRTSTSCARRWLSSAAATCKKLLLSEEGKRVIIIAGTLHLGANSRDEYLAAVADVAVEARRAPGCLDFVQAADQIDPERINVYERWASDGDLLRFRSVDGANPALPPLAAAAVAVAKYLIAAVEAP